MTSHCWTLVFQRAASGTLAFIGQGSPSSCTPWGMRNTMTRLNKSNIKDVTSPSICCKFIRWRRGGGLISQGSIISSRDPSATSSLPTSSRTCCSLCSHPIYNKPNADYCQGSTSDRENHNNIVPNVIICFGSRNCKSLAVPFVWGVWTVICAITF